MTKSKTPITPAAVKRTQSATAKKHEGMVPKGAYVGRMQRALATAAPKAQAPAQPKQSQPKTVQKAGPSKSSSRTVAHIRAS